MSLTSKAVRIVLPPFIIAWFAFPFTVFFIVTSSSQVIKKEDLCISPGKVRAACAFMSSEVAMWPNGVVEITQP